MTHKLFIRILICCIAIALAGCSTPMRRPGQQWSGKFSVSSVYKKKASRDSGTFLLTKSTDSSELILKGPLGAAAAVIEDSPSGAILKVPNEPDVRATTSASLAMRLIGAPISLDQLADWLESNGNLDTSPADDLRDNGWTVNIEKNDNTIRRITAERNETKSQPAVKLILIPTPR
ncbi:MAG: hypothetical protein LUC43_04545 [Burkholderiales bacterium]|nr:hypothetical protein [Burkholderiales bacterium]